MKFLLYLCVMHLAFCVGLLSFLPFKASEKVERQTQEIYFYDAQTVSRKERICLLRGYDKNDTMIFQTAFLAWGKVNEPETLYSVQKDETAIVRVEAQYCRNE